MLKIRFTFFSGTLQERGFFTEDAGEKNKYTHEEFLSTRAEAYNIPYMDVILKRIKFLKYLPFIQHISDKSNNRDASLQTCTLENHQL